MVERSDLQADCPNCFGLCCVVPAFAASVDFAIDKPAEQPCPNLQPDSACGIHQELRPRGFRGCTVYDCFGAGQRVSRVTLRGRDWRDDPVSRPLMFSVFPIMRQLHELLWYLGEALTWPAASPLHGALRESIESTETLAQGAAEALTSLDIEAHRRTVNALLLRSSELARAEVPGRTLDHRGADLIGARFAGADLTGASLRGAYLIGADLRSAELRLADVIGADFRDADVRGARLGESLFLIQSQLDSAQGDARTTVPPALTQPTHWVD